MKCPNCNQAFCWLCGVAIDDTPFPAHFQWWYVGGCPNMQLNEEINPSRAAVLRAKLLSWIETLILGPLTFGATVISFFACPCVVLGFSCFNRTETDTFSRKIVRLFQECMTSWGMFWISVLFFFPLFTICGVLVFAAAAFIYPFYATVRICNGQVPCPDFIMACMKNFCSRLGNCCVRCLPRRCFGNQEKYRPVDINIPPEHLASTTTNTTITTNVTADNTEATNPENPEKLALDSSAVEVVIQS